MASVNSESIVDQTPRQLREIERRHQELLDNALGGAAVRAFVEQQRKHQQLLDAASGITPAPKPAASLALPSPSGAPTPLKSAADIGALVRKARKRLKMSQTEFALHAGVGRRFLSELENGKGSIEFNKVLACAAAAGIDLIAYVRSGA